jgi:hypothetical protein
MPLWIKGTDNGLFGALSRYPLLDPKNSPPSELLTAMLTGARPI